MDPRAGIGLSVMRVPMGAWEKLLFASLAPAAPLEEVLRPVRERCSFLPLDQAAFEPARSRDYLVNANWALYVDNYLEGYHIPIAHPGLMREIDYAQYRTDTFRYYSQQFAPIRAMKAEDAGERFYAPGTGLQQALYFWIFPNLMLNIYPDNISTNVIVPLSTEKTLTKSQRAIPKTKHSQKP